MIVRHRDDADLREYGDFLHLGMVLNATNRLSYTCTLMLVHDLAMFGYCKPVKFRTLLCRGDVFSASCPDSSYVYTWFHSHYACSVKVLDCDIGA